MPDEQNGPVDHRLRRRERLRLARDFDRIFRLRRSSADAALVVYAAENGLPWCRLGLAVSRRLGGAVQRNRIKRRLREAFRRLKPDLPPGYDLVCVARAEARDPGVDLAESMLRLARKCLQRRR